MAKKMTSRSQAQGPFDSMIDMGIGALVFIFILIIAPFIGATVTGMMPAVTPGSSWDQANSTVLPDPAQTWGQIITVIILAMIIIVLVIVIAYLRGMGKA